LEAEARKVRYPEAFQLDQLERLALGGELALVPVRQQHEEPGPRVVPGERLADHTGVPKTVLRHDRAGRQPGRAIHEALPRLSAEAAKEAADGTIGLQQPPCPIHALHPPQPFLRLTQQRLELANTASQPAEAPQLHPQVLAVQEQESPLLP